MLLRIRGYRLSVYLLAGLMIFLGATGFLFTYGLSWYSRQIAVTANRDFEARDIERTLADLLLNMEQNRKKFLLFEKNEYRDLYEEDAERFTRKMEELETLLVSEDERTSWSRLVSLFEPHAHLQADPAEAGGEPQGAMRPLDPSLEEVQQLMLLNQIQMDLHLKQMDHLTERSLKMGLLLAVGSIFMAGILSALLIRSITRPIRRLQRGTREIAAGRFSHRVDVPSQDEMGDLADAFNEMANQLKKLDELKTDFIAIVSHELRTPLTSMKEAVELLGEEAVGPLVEKQKTLLKITAAGINKLSIFIDDILNLTTLEGGMVPMVGSRIDFQELVFEKIETFRLLADKKRIRLSAEFVPDPFPPVNGDGLRLRQVLANLVSNAIHHTGTGGEIHVQVSSCKGRALSKRVRLQTGRALSRQWVLVTVLDSGEGIPREEWNRVFDKFYQIHGEKPRTTGTGLGLSIAKHIVEAHGGLIWVEDSSRRGTAISFAGPLREVPDPAEARGPGEQPPLPRTVRRGVDPDGKRTARGGTRPARGLAERAGNGGRWQPGGVRPGRRGPPGAERPGAAQGSPIDLPAVCGAAARRDRPGELPAGRPAVRYAHRGGPAGAAAGGRSEPPRGGAEQGAAGPGIQAEEARGDPGGNRDPAGRLPAQVTGSPACRFLENRRNISWPT